MAPSFVKPESDTRVCIRTYLFRDSTKVQKFLDFIKEKFPNRKVDVKQLDNGKVSVSLTSNSSQFANNNSTEETFFKCGNVCFKYIEEGVSKYGSVFKAFHLSNCNGIEKIIPFITFKGNCGSNFSCMSKCTMQA